MKPLLLCCPLVLGILGALSLFGCSSSDVPGPEYVQSSWITRSSEPSVDRGSTELVGTRILAGLYFKEDDCMLGKEAMYLYYDLGQACYAWWRNVDSSIADNLGDEETERPNSAGNWQCYENVLCFTEYTANSTCGEDMMVTQKRVTTVCMKDENTDMFIRLLGGTENCPEAPPNLEELCPAGIISGEEHSDVAG